MEIVPLLLLMVICATLLVGFPVALTLAGVSIIFALICIPLGIFDPTIFKSIPIRIFGIMNNVTLLAVPLFIFMGTILEKSGIAAKMLENMAKAFRSIKGGLSISIIIVGALLAAGPIDMNLSKIMGFFAVILASINIFGGFIVAQRMLQMFKKKK